MVVGVEQQGRAKDTAPTDRDPRPRLNPCAVQSRPRPNPDTRVPREGDQHVLLSVRPGVDVISDLDAPRSDDDEPAVGSEIPANTNAPSVAEANDQPPVGADDTNGEILQAPSS